MHVRRHPESFRSFRKEKRTLLKPKSSEPITDPKEQKDRWVEHYSELYLRETFVNDAVLNSINPFPVMEKLEAKLNIEELKKAVDALSNGKAPGIPRPAGLPSLSSLTSCSVSAGRLRPTRHA